MAFEIRMGIPEMEYYWQEMVARQSNGELSKGEIKIFKKLINAFYHLSLNPRYPGLCSHEITALTRIAGIKIWESYIENGTPAAGRIFWAYGPGKNMITIVGFEPHPEDRKKAGYNKVRLSDIPPL